MKKNALHERMKLFLRVHDKYLQYDRAKGKLSVTFVVEIIN